MEQASLWVDEREERALLGLLDRLEVKKVSWERFLQKVGDPMAASRLASAKGGRSLLHLAILDNRLDVVQTLRKDPSLSFRRDLFGLSPIEMAQLLNRKEALHFLRPPSEAAHVPALPQLKCFEYLPHPIFEACEGFRQVLSYTAKAKRKDKIPASKIWMGIYFDKEIRNGAHPPVSICHINDKIGYGVFADKKVAPCTFVGEYTGVVQERSPKQLKEKKYCLRYTLWEGKKNFTIDAEEKGNFTRFINHSAAPNLSLQSVYWRGLPRMIFVSMKEIPEGEQLTFDYGPLFWKQ